MDELELQTREALDGRPITQNIFPFQACPARPLPIIVFQEFRALSCWRHMRAPPIFFNIQEYRALHAGAT